MAHIPKASKTLSAPNPISTVYKKLAFFTDDTLCFTDFASLNDMEIVDITNSFIFSGNQTFLGSIAGNTPPTELSNIHQADVSQLLSDVYSGSTSGQVVDSEFNPAVSGYVFQAVGGDSVTGGNKYGFLHSLKLEAESRYNRDLQLETNQQTIETFINGSAWAWDSPPTWVDFVDTEAPYFLSASQDIVDAFIKVDNQLQVQKTFLTSLWNEIQGSDVAVTEPAPDGIISGVAFENNLFSMGQSGGSADTYYVSSTGNALVARPDGTANTESLTAVNSRSSILELDKELRRNEVWTNKINKFLTGDNLNAESTSGGAFAFSQDTTHWTGLSNVPSDGTYMRPWNELAQAPTGIVPSNLRQALKNIDVNMRMIDEKATLNYRASGSNVGLMPDNANRGNIQDLRQDVNLMAVELGSAADSTDSLSFNYAEPTMNYPHGGTRTLMADVLKIDDNLGNMQTMVAGAISNGVDNYSTDVPGTSTVKDNINWIHDEGWSDANSLSNRLVKVVDTSSNIVFTENIDIDNAKFMRYPKGQDFAGTEPYGSTTDWGQYVVNKNYVDGVTNGLIYRPNVDCVAAANITLSGDAQTIDGVSATAGKRVLCIGQSTAADNGVYVAAAGAWARATDFLSGTALRTWTYWVAGGTIYGNRHMNVGGDNTTYTIGSSDIDGWVSIWKTFGLQGGIGTSPNTDRIDVNTGKSLYTDGTDGSTLNVNIAGYSGTYSGAPHSDVWSAGNTSNRSNPIQYLDGAGQGSGLTLKYTSDFSLSGSGELQIDEVGGVTGSEIVWAFDTSKYAESATPGDSGSGSTSLFWGDASSGATRWANLREIAGNADQQVAQLATDGKPEFASVGIGTAADTTEPGGDGYKLKIHDAENACRFMLNATSNKDACLLFWTGASNAIRGGVGYDHSDGTTKLFAGTGLATDALLAINSDAEIGIGRVPQSGVAMTIYDENPSIWLINDTVNEDESGSIIMTETTDAWAAAGSYGFRILHDGDYVDAAGGANGAFKIQTTNNGTVKTPVTIDRASGFVGLGAAFADVGTGPIIPDAPLHLFSGADTMLKIESNDANSRIVFEDREGGVDYNAYVGAQKNGVYLGKANTWGSSDNIHVKDGKLLVGGNANTVTTTNATSNPAVPLEIRNGTDLDLTVGSGYFQIGDNTSSHLKFDVNEIQCIAGNADQTTEGTAQDLYINPHGGVVNLNYSSTPYLNLGSNAANATHTIDISSPTPHIHLGDSNNDNANGTPVITFGMESPDPTFATTGYYMKLGPWKHDGTPNRHMYYSLDAQSLYNTGASSSGHLTQHKFEIGEVEVMRIHRACTDGSGVAKNAGGVSINAKTLDDAADVVPFTIHGHTNQNATQNVKSYGNNTDARPLLSFGKYAGSASAKAIVADGHTLGQIAFAGYTTNGSWGDNLVRGCSIQASVDGTPDAGVSNDLPTRLTFSINPGDSAMTNPLIIHPDGQIQVGDTSSTPQAQFHIKANGNSKQLRLERTGTGPWKADIGVRDLGTNDEVLAFYANDGYSGATADGVFLNGATHYMKKDGSFYSKGNIVVGGSSAITLSTSGLINTNNIDVAGHVHLKTGADLKMSTTAIPGTASPIVENTDDTGVSINSLGGQLKLGHRTCSAVKLMVDLLDSSGTTLIDESARSFNGSLTGNAGSATKLNTARTIGGQSFDGTSNINLPGVNTFGGYADYVKSQNAAAGNDYYIAGFQTSGGTSGQELYSDAQIKFNSAGDLYCQDLLAAGDVICSYSSDSRMKDNQKSIENSLDSLDKINGISFDWNEHGPHLNPKKDLGVIAQEVQEVYPELVEERKNGMLAVNYNGLIPVLIEAVKELKAEIEELKRGK
jgi:hypothetical protein